MLFIKLTLTNGRGVCVINIPEVQAISGNEIQTEVYMNGGACFVVSESIEKVMDKMNMYNDFDYVEN